MEISITDGSAMEKFWEALIYATLTLAGIKIKEWVEKLKASRIDRVKKLKTSTEYVALINERVKNQENDIMKVYRPVTMFVFHFSNGEVTDLNLSLKKISIRHEITLYPERPYLTEHYQVRPLPEMFYEGVNETFKKGHYVFSMNSLEKNPPLKDFYETWDIQSMLWVALRNGNGAPAAIMVMQWPGDISINNADILKIKAKKIDIENIYKELSI